MLRNPKCRVDFNNWSEDEPIYLRLALSNVTNPMIRQALGG